MTDNHEPTTQALAKASPDAFLLFDREDDQQILARMQGAALREMVYAFPQGRDTIHGISVAGADECKRELARMGEVIREDDCRIESETPDEARFVAKASRWSVSLDGRPQVMLDTSVEFKRQEKYITFRSGDQGPDDSWYEKGASKAMRNAVLKLIPQALKQALIEKHRQHAKVVGHTPESADAATNKYHTTMDAKDEREKKVRDLKAAWRRKELTKAQVGKILRDKHLSESLADDHVSWMTVDEAVVDELLAAAK